MASIKSPLAHRLKIAPDLAPRISWQMRRLLRQAGAGATAGVTCIALAVLALWHASELAQRQQTLTRQLDTAVRTAAAPRAPVITAADGVAAFHAYLPPHDTIPDQLKELVRLAAQSGITLAKAEYKPEQEEQIGCLRYRITLPIKAEFASVQSFIINALQALPTLMLESVAIKREQIESGEIEASIQFVLLVRQREQRP